MLNKRVTEIMTESPIDTIERGLTTSLAASVMKDRARGCLVVVDSGKPIGIITERGILRRIVALNKQPEKILCKNIMSRPLKIIYPDNAVLEAIERMSKYNIKKLIVTENKELVGVLSVTDIIKSGQKIEDDALKKLARLYPICRPVDSEKPFT